LQFNNTVLVLLSSPATVAIIVAYFLDLTMRRGDTSTRRDSGRHWWEKFRNFNQDIRSEGFYSLPFNLNKFFPSLWVHFHFKMNKRKSITLRQSSYDIVQHIIVSSIEVVCINKDIRAKDLQFIPILSFCLTRVYVLEAEYSLH